MDVTVDGGELEQGEVEQGEVRWAYARNKGILRFISRVKHLVRYDFGKNDMSVFEFRVLISAPEPVNGEGPGFST